MSISDDKEMAKPAEKSIRFSIAVDEKFQKLAIKLGRSKMLLLEQMVDYFYRTKKDPMDLSDEMLKSSILKNAQNQIAFLKTQEKIFLFPLNDKIGEVLEQQGEILEALDEQVLQANQVQGEEHKKQLQHLSDIYHLLKNLNTRMDDKADLKHKFLYILNNYISLREKITGFLSGKEKEELVSETRRQIERL
ncbi:MAG: hypothetical protein EOP48_00285 [Sphingobacteriales bacterium]|nr:MAG: hypothetical protein EOP48_00285 [Sphingobacteriales bacterium]